ncbi:MAG: DEAD/DEAH box helicase [Candidatus Thorarchaeota archaeon]
MSTLRKLELAQVSPRLLEILRTQGLASLTEFQLSAIEKRITSGASQMLLTHDFEEAYQIAEIAVLNKVASDFRAKVLVLTPNPHLAEKRYQSLSQRCKRLGIETSIISRRRRATSPEKIRGRIVVATFSSVSIALRTHPEILENLEAVLIERLDLIGQPDIGAKLETVIVSLLKLEETKQYISICPPVDNIEDLRTWLNAVIIKDPKSDMKVIYSVKAFDNIYESLSDLTEFVHQKRGQIMILCPNRSASVDLALKLSGVRDKSIALDLGLSVGHKDELKEFGNDIKNHFPKCESSVELGRTITNGVAFFHEGVSSAQRRAISAAWEDELLPVIVMPARFAIASGLRASIVFLMGVFMEGITRDDEFEGLVMLSEWELNDLLLSAGRRGRDNEAFSIVVVDNESERQRVLAKYFEKSADGNISPCEGEVDSSMDDPDNIQDLVLGQLCGSEMEGDDSFAILGRTFWAISNRLTGGAKKEDILDMESSVDELVSLRATKSTIKRATDIPASSLKLVSATPDKIEGLVHSHSRDLWHHVILRAKEGVSCTCESWKYQGIRKHRLCKHLVRFVTFVIQEEGVSSYAAGVVNQALTGLEILDELEKDGLISRAGQKSQCTDLGESVTVLGIPVRDAKRLMKVLSRKESKLHDIIFSMAIARSNLPKSIIQRVLETTKPGIEGEFDWCEDDMPGMIENTLEEIQYINSILAGFIRKEHEGLKDEIGSLEERVQFLLKSVR